MMNSIAIPPPERSDFVCESGHRLFRYWTSPLKAGHMLLCPICDRQTIEELLTEQRERSAPDDAELPQLARNHWS